MRTIVWRCTNGPAGCLVIGELEVDDDTSDEEIEILVNEAVHGVIDWDWREVKSTEQKRR